MYNECLLTMMSMQSLRSSDSRCVVIRKQSFLLGEQQIFKNLIKVCLKSCYCSQVQYNEFWSKFY